MVFAASVDGAQHETHSVEKKPAISLIVPLDKVLARTVLSLRGRQVVRPAV